MNSPSLNLELDREGDVLFCNGPCFQNLIAYAESRNLHRMKQDLQENFYFSDQGAFRICHARKNIRGERETFKDKSAGAT